MASIFSRKYFTPLQCITLLGASVLISGTHAYAQEPTLIPTFRTITVVGSYGGLYYDLKGKPKPVLVSLDQGLSRHYARPPGTMLEVFREFPVPPDSPPGTKPIRLVAFSATVPQKMIRSIIITAPKSSKRTDPLDVHVLDNDSPAHVAGTLLVANYSTSTAAFAIDDTQNILPSGDIQIIPCPKSFSVLLQVALQKGSGWVSTFKSESINNPNLRGYVLIFDYMDDPDYKANAIHPVALVKTFYETSPEIMGKIKKAVQAQPPVTALR